MSDSTITDSARKAAEEIVRLYCHHHEWRCPPSGHENSRLCGSQCYQHNIAAIIERHWEEDKDSPKSMVRDMRLARAVLREVWQDQDFNGESFGRSLRNNALGIAMQLIDYHFEKDVEMMKRLDKNRCAEIEQIRQMVSARAEAAPRPKPVHEETWVWDES